MDQYLLLKRLPLILKLSTNSKKPSKKAAANKTTTSDPQPEEGEGTVG